MADSRRVAITGIGAITPLGLSFPSSWDALIAGKSAIAPITRFNASGLRWKQAAELLDFDPLKYVTHKDVLRFDPFAIYALIAAREALQDSHLHEDSLASAGIVMGSGRGGISTLEQAAHSRPTAYTMAGTTVSMAASFAAGRLGLKGHIAGVSCACASGTAAIGTALDLIRSGRLKAVAAGGAEAPLTPLCQRGYGQAGALSKSGKVNPFGPERDGFVLGEGAAVLVLEDMDSARARGANIYAELAGYGNSGDEGHPTKPDAQGEARAMRAALDDSCLAPSGVDLIMAHATSTPLGDAAEAEAIRAVFGNNNKDAPLLCALKAATGHMLAASGAFEAAAAAYALHRGVIPPTANAGRTEFGLTLHSEPREAEIMAALSNSFGFGGVNTTLTLLKAPDTN